MSRRKQSGESDAVHKDLKPDRALPEHLAERLREEARRLGLPEEIVSDASLRRAIIDTTMGVEVESEEPAIRRVTEQTRVILAEGGTVDIPPEIAEAGMSREEG